MHADYELVHVQAQYLLITPQLKQSLNVLQLGVNELNELAELEVAENPFLEQEQVMQAATEEGECERQKLLTAKRSDSVCMPDYQPVIYTGIPASDGRLNYLESVACQTVTLLENLSAQIRELEIPDKLRKPTGYIIGNLDENGYLSISLDEIANTLNCRIQDVQNSLEIVQSLEPAGIAARDLRECLLLQLDRIGKIDSLEAELLKKHAHLIESGSLYEISEQEEVSMPELENALECLSALNPFPGMSFSNEKTTLVIPEILISKSGNDFIVTVNQAALLKVYLNHSYDKIFNRRKELSASDRNFINSKMRSACWFLRCIEERQQTLLKISRAVVNYQQSFFENGCKALKPLALADIAEETGMHESTVSRAIANKFMDSPQGILSFKSLFSAGIKTEAGLVSKHFIKESIHSLISKEMHSRPATDQQITEFFRNSGIKIARRTVTKYREDLGIPCANLRKNHDASDKRRAFL